MTSSTPQADQRNGRCSSSAATQGRERIRVLLADDHPAVRVGMQPDMLVVFEARDAEAALARGGCSEDDLLGICRQPARGRRTGRRGRRAAEQDLARRRALPRGPRAVPRPPVSAVPRSLARALSIQLRPDDRAILWTLLADAEPGEIAQRLRLSLRQLDDQRGRMLLALAASHAAGQYYAPLDYDRARRPARDTVG